MTKFRKTAAADLGVGDVVIGFDGLPEFEIRRIAVQRDGLVMAYDHSGHRYSQFPADEVVEVVA